jgi:hypothetical protein
MEGIAIENKCAVPLRCDPNQLGTESELGRQAYSTWLPGQKRVWTALNDEVIDALSAYLAAELGVALDDRDPWLRLWLEQSASGSQTAGATPNDDDVRPGS